MGGEIMHRQFLGLEQPFIASGAGIVAGDTALTVLAGKQSLHDICQNICQSICTSGEQHTVCNGCGHSLASCLPADLSTQLQALLSQGQDQCQWDWVSPAVFGQTGARAVRLHISASRLEGANHQGQPVYHVVFSDVSAAATLLHEAELEKKKYAIIAEITEDIPFEYDFATDTMVFAEKYCSFFGDSARIPHFCQRVADGEKVDAIHALFCTQLAVQPECRANASECHVRTKDGSYRWFSLLCKLVTDEESRPVMAVGAIRNIDRQKMEQLRLLEKSRTDAMTGLRNKENTEEEIRKALAFVGPGSMGALLMVDIDNFKLVNDTKGHLAGDAVLVRLARQLSRTFRSDDIVGRVGGDEFHIFMRNIAKVEDIHEKVQELCTKVRELFARSELGPCISISVGITWVEYPVAYSALFRQADVALYRAKARGKNCYEFFGKSNPTEQREQLPAHSPAQPAGARLQPRGRTVRNTLVLDIIDTLCSSLFSHLSDMGNMDQRIGRALHFIGNALDVSAIVIYEKSFDGQYASISHEWVASETWSRKASCQNVPIENIPLPKATQPGGIYYCSDVGALPQHDRTVSNAPGVASLLQCDIVCDNLVIGHIRFEERRSARIWEQQEVEALSLMSKLVSGYISQKQSAGLLQRSTQATRDILDSLPATFVCVISKETRNLLYFNARVLELFPMARVGMTCHEIFKDCTGPCSTCPRSQLAGENAYVSLLYDSPFGKVARLSVSKILWENRELAYVALISEYEPTQEEKEQQKRKEAYLQALQNNFTEIYEVDLDENSVKAVLRTDQLVVYPVPGQSYTSYMQVVGEQHVHPQDRALFFARFNVESMRNNAERQRFFKEFRIINAKKECVWISTLVLPLREERNCKLLVLCQNVTQNKRMEDASRRLERRYTALFRQSCDMLVEINLDTGAYLRTAFSTNYPYFPSRATYDESFQDLLAYLHPDDREVVDPARSLAALRATWEAGIAEQSCQFRLRQHDSYRWIESRLFFLSEEDAPTAFLLGRDISVQKELEEERRLEEQRFSLALRDIYCEIYELDTVENTSKLLFSSNTKLLPVGVTSLEKTQDIINNALHPDDRAHVTASFSGASLRARFEQGCSEVVEEFRRLGRAGTYHWVSAVVVPLRDQKKAVSNKVMLLVKDISLRKKQEQQQRLHEQYTLALQNIYDELFECNVTQNSYRTVYHVPNKYMIPPQSGTLSEAVLDIALHMVHPDDSQRFLDFFSLDTLRESFATGKEYLEAEFRKKLLRGGYHWASLAVFPLRAVDGDDEMFIVFVMDINQRKKAEEIARHNIFLERQRLADERYKIIVEQTNTLVFEWAREDGMHYISPELVERFAGAYSDRDIMQVWQDDAVIHPDDLSAFASFMDDSRTQQHPEMTVRFRKRDGTFIWCKVVLSCLSNAQGELVRYIGTLNDVHDATCSVIALHYRAEYDMLTGIFNMQAFYARAEQLLRENPDCSYSILRMDIDRFKVINELYGLEAGDLLLKTMARLISERMNAQSVCGRISGDVFCMCVDYSEEEILNFIDAMTAELAKYPLTSRLVPSFGICRVDSRDTPINVLCDWAHLALKTVKGNVLVSHAFYDETLRKRILEEKKIETEMHFALEDGQFQLYLQPKVQIATEKIVGFEGLVRWQHPTEGLIQPDRFIPLFEKNGFIIRLDEYVWEQSCILLRTWLDRGKKVMPVSVNVSRMHIHDTRLCEKLLDLMTRYNLPPHMLELELTESVFLDNEKNLVETMETLQKHGFLFSLDDFGAGYSSLNMLKSLPIDTIKIDRGFLTEVAATERGKTIIRHTISLANALQMKVIAEGVENASQAAFLQDAGCAVAQGFYYSPPVPIAVFEKMAFEHMCLLPRGHS